MTDGSRRLTATWVPVAMLLVAILASTVRNDFAVLKGELYDPDAYMRLTRVELLLRNGDWFDGTIPQANTPYGDRLHWTRPLDVLIVALAAPLLPLLGLERAVYWAGMAIGPLLYLLSLPALYWAVRPLLDREHRFYLGYLFLFQLAILAQFLVGRPDHHGLLCLIFILLLGQLLRLVAEAPPPRLAVAAGLTVALHIWVAPEALVAGFLAMVTLGLLWLGRGGAGLAWRNLGFAAGAVAGIGLALAVERPPGEWLAIEHDRISLFHLLAFSLLAGFWALLCAVPALSRRPAARLAAAAAGAGAAAAFIGLLFPEAIAGPLAALDERVRALWFVVIAEAQSPIVPGHPGVTAHRLLSNLGPLLVAAPVLAWQLRRSTGAARRQWAVLALFLAAYVGLSLDELRWMFYPQVLMLPAYAVGMVAALDRLGLRERPAGAERHPGRLALFSLGRVIVVLLFGGGFLLLASLVPATLGSGQDRGCDNRGIAAWLSARPGLGDAPQRIMAFNFVGAELIYRTPHGFVATPYHRNRDGILDAHDFFSATGQEAAADILRRRGIDLVLVCPSSLEHRLYLGGDAPTVFERLRDRTQPDWLRPLDLPPGLVNQWLLYRVEL